MYTALNEYPMPTMGTNPYESQMASDSTAIGAATQSIQNQQAKAPAQNTPAPSSYPAYPNQYGLGAPINAPKEDPNKNQANPNALQGANPWSLMGEANVRGQ